MYKFIDVNQHRSADSRLPSEALFLNGQAIEDVIKGYRTLTVSGRELVAPKLNTVPRTNNDGAIYLNKRYPPRTITVQYQLVTEDNELFRLSYEALNRLLNQGQQELRFNDDLAYSYTGTLSETSDVPTGTNSVVGSFSFYCNDPFKYRDLEVVTGTNPQIIYDETYLIKPDFINVTFGAETENFKLTSGDKEIKIPDFVFLQGDTIPIDFINNSIDEGYYEVMEYVSLDSNFEDFYIRSGVPIKLNTPATIEVGYRRKAL